MQINFVLWHFWLGERHLASFTKEVKPRLAKRPLVFNGRLANRGLTSLVKEATGPVVELLAFSAGSKGGNLFCMIE